jgi:hypothetical protein
MELFPIIKRALSPIAVIAVQSVFAVTGVPRRQADHRHLLDTSVRSHVSALEAELEGIMSYLVHRMRRRGEVLLLVFKRLRATSIALVAAAAQAWAAFVGRRGGARGENVGRQAAAAAARVRRGSRITALILVSLVAACGGGGSGGNNSGGTSTNGPVDPGDTSTNVPVTFASFFPSDLFSSPRVPLELAATPATDGVVSIEVGSAGGTLTATGPDGTIYTLEIPPDALSITTTITATPLQDVTGFPFDAQPSNRLGVAFSPSGLKFAKSATLTISPPNLPDNVGIAAFGYVGVGHDAAGVTENIQPGRVTISVDHFSGYVLTWPVNLPEWRQIAQLRIEAQEQQMQQIMSTFMGVMRQKQLLGMDTSADQSLRDFALSWVKSYQQEVLIPTLNAAALGCDEGQKALTAWFSYWRQLQVLGLADDPAFAVVFNGVTYTSEFDLPERLVPTFFDRCMQELYQRCVATGDFFQLPQFIFGLDRQWQLLGEVLDPALINVAVDYTTRCGHWKLEESANFATNTEALSVSETVTSSIELQWKAGAGEGIGQFLQSTIEGTGHLVVTDFNFIDKLPGHCNYTYDTPVERRQPTAKLKELTWEYPDDPATPTWAKSGYVTVLKLSFDPGDVVTGITTHCPDGPNADVPQDFYVPLVAFAYNGFGPDPKESSDTYLLDRGWTFQSLSPFRADWSADAGDLGAVTLKLKHAPN